MHDKNIQIQMANFAKEILCSYREATMVAECTTEIDTNKCKKTRSGRECKKINKVGSIRFDRLGGHAPK